MINVGIIGIGFMGVTHYKALQSVEGARVCAISTRDAQKLAGDWSGVQGNFGDSGGVQDVSQLACYEDWQELLKDETVDLVSICLPTHLHREATVAALRAGKHVLVEKPLALNLEDADAMIDAAAQANRQLMVGQVLRFFPAFAELQSIVEDGRYGKLLGAHLKRIIAAPAWAKDDHFSDVSKSGGAAIDLHIHDTDFVHYLAGVPQCVRSTGVAAGGALTYIQTQYLYDEMTPCISAQSGAIAMPGLAFEHGFDAYLENATIQYHNLFTNDELWIYERDGSKQIVCPDRADAFTAQWQHAVDCVQKGEPSKLIDAPIARESLAVCLLEEESARSGKTMKIDVPQN